MPNIPLRKRDPGAQLNPRLTQGSTTGAHAGLAQLTSTHLRFNSTTDALGTVSATGDSLLQKANELLAGLSYHKVLPLASA